jgi:hypothetical protein
MERYTDPMSGEPAITAAKVLGRVNFHTSLYQYLFQDVTQLIPEVASECLHHLTTVPISLIPGLIDRFGESENDLILAGLFDLLIGHESGVQGREYLLSFVESSKRYDAYRYLVALIISDSRGELLPTVLPLIKNEKDESKVFILIDAFDPLSFNKEIEQVLTKLKRALEDDRS